ncbi:hypothetical protein LL06_09020 [Hoeflea sp. BAL378]|uniref:Bug family tripartite tricarboxylate transporter substrate binding protein n=1 Tax=Hoeflea sp. BAL378 TaxID=1547437 RepID=UPI000513CE4B|nr:tripartite tricarboxylate transporter substrate binding protein [Hoeflea sp. BAL378]KGF69815.1 hypothetical protein LL06_09020 [Hoeflea sp. BAL378]
MLTRMFLAATAIAMAGLTPTMAQETDWPTDTVKIVIPFSAGGGTDTLGRTLADAFSQAWGQPVIVENRDGANGNLGTDYVARAKNDGNTILMTTNATIAINPQLFDTVKYDPIRDLAPISLISSLPFVLVAYPGVEADSLQELIDLAKSRPGELTFGSSGAGGGAHLAGELLKTMAEIDITHIPYRGSGPSIPALIGGHVDFMFVSILTAMPHIKEGTLKPLAVSSLTRSPALPDVPAVAELPGLEGFSSDLWYGFLAPAGTDPAILKKIADETHKVLSAPAMKEQFEPRGAILVGNSPEEFQQLIASDIEKWSKVIKAANIKAE